MLTAKQVETAYLAACELDVAVLKPGNVSVQSAGHGMEAAEFLESAKSTSSALSDKQLQSGVAILECARATHAAVGCNTNLGIILLCVPLARAGMACDTKEGFHIELQRNIGECDVVQTQAVFDAIRLMSPAGLGEHDKHDVNDPADVPLLEAMNGAAAYDQIAWQYANGFDDIINFGSQSYVRAIQQGLQLDGCRTVTGRDASDSCHHAVVSVYLDFVCEYPDSHVARKYGATMAEAVRDEARSKRDEYGSLTSKEARQQCLAEFDRELKDRGINPGTSADLTVATIFYQLMVADLTERTQTKEVWGD